ncbi:MAG: putative alpha/beta superfamily hydrolase [Saprospiraceae bacterium]|jgi:predicted alpha/beta superfamily hydrolase
MKKILLRLLLLGLILFGLFVTYKKYNKYKEEQRYEEYLKTIVDTSSPTVTVLKDSILIGYQNDKRTIHIYVPPEYDSDSTSQYPVIYMMDGESSFNDMANMAPEWQIDEVINQASAAGKQTAIVIGIEQAEDRDTEYTPFVNEDNPDAHGAEFSKWVTTDLKNIIDANYRTKKEAEFTGIGGISRSGMMAYYMLMAHPDVFGNAIIQSPSMWVDHDRLFEMELTETQLENKKIFVSVGEYEGGIMIPHAKEVYEKFKNQGLKDDQLNFEMILDEAHWHPTWRKSFALAYPWLME